MPRRSKGARLYLQPPRVDKATGNVLEPASWAIRDGTVFKRTGFAEHNLEGAQRALHAYQAVKYDATNRTPGRRAADILIADVLSVYLDDVVARHARPKETVGRIEALLNFWGTGRLSEVVGRTCRAYAASRPSVASARRELEDLRSAISHHRREGLCSEIVSVVLPEKSQPRDRWLTRSEVAAMLWKAWRYREIQKGRQTGRKSRQHVARFILVAFYTGTRSGAICSASFKAEEGKGFIDLGAGVFHRRKQGVRETKKRQPPVRLPSRLLAHLRRWDRLGISKAHAVEWYGEPIGRINKAFRNVALDAGLAIDDDGHTDVTPHIMRHTAATHAMRNGLSLEDAADLLGMTTEVLRSTYYHHHPDFQKEAAEKMGRGTRAPAPASQEPPKPTRTPIPDTAPSASEKAPFDKVAYQREYMRQRRARARAAEA